MTDSHACGLPGPPGLWDAERRLLAACRVWASCRSDRHAPQGRLGEALAALFSPRVAALFGALMTSLEAGSRRQLRMNCGACPGYADDEQRLVLACGVAAAAPDVAVRLLAPLIADPEPAACLARALNAALAADGLALPVRLCDCASPLTPTRH